MNSVRERPSCILALYSGNATMMSDECELLHIEQPFPEPQIHHIADGTVLVTSNQGEFDMYCPKVSPATSIQACKLCTFRLPCGCYIKSKGSLVPPLMDHCVHNMSVTNVTYPINLHVLSQLLTEPYLRH